MPESDPKWLFFGVSGSLEPQGCSSWSTMVAGHWYTVPHYATALPGSIVGFKIPTLANIWPEMPLNCSFWVVFWWFLPPRSPRGVQVGPRCWQDTGILSHTMPQPYQVPLWALKSQIWTKNLARNAPPNAHFGRFGLPLVKALEGEPFVLRGFLLTVSSAHEYSLQSPNCLWSVSHLSNVSSLSSVSSLSTLSSVRSAYVDPWDMLNNFCF